MSVFYGLSENFSKRDTSKNGDFTTPTAELRRAEL